MLFCAADIAEALGIKGAFPGGAFTGVAIDSRAVQPGELFVALKGDNFDGATFIAAACAAGATAILCDHGAAANVPVDVQCFAVDDTLAAFRRLAQRWRHRFSVPVIAVAGSVGKTSSKDMLAALLQGRWDAVLKTEASQNGFIGIPLTLMQLRAHHGAAVIEVGIDEVGAMAQHWDVVRPGFAIVTAIAEEHLEKLHDLKTVAAEERLILEKVALAGGFIIINADDPLVAVPSLSSLAPGKAAAFSLDESAAPDGIPLLSGRLDPDQTAISLSGLGIDGLKLPVLLPGRHNARNLLGAVAVARCLGLSAAEICKGLATFVASTGRSELQRLKDGTIVVCDYYNASPASVKAGLDLAQGIHEKAAGSHDLWLCLGDMLELGSEELDYHRALAHPIIRSGATKVLCFGPRMAALAAELKEQGFCGLVRHFTVREELAAELTQARRAGDTILIKGSRGMRMEKIWLKLKEGM